MKPNLPLHTRYHRLDHLRAITLISMILYHAAWDLVYLFDVPIHWYKQTPAYVWQQSICWTFIFLSGFCWNMGRRPWKRGLLIFLGGLAVTLITAIFMPDSIVLFGILTFLGSAVCLTSLLHPLLRHITPLAGMIAAALCFILTRNVNQGFLGFESWNLCSLPKQWYENLFSTFFGFPQPGFFSTDYFSLIPWIFLFLAGYYFYGIMERNHWNRYIEGRPLPFLSFIGRHSLILYLVHQPVLFGLLSLITRQCTNDFL